MLPERVTIETRSQVDEALSFVPKSIPRPRSRGTAQTLSEWWLLRSWLRGYPDDLPVEFPLSAEKGERPDFVLQDSLSRNYLLEVTQASHSKDQHAMAKAPDTGAYLMSDHGGRGKGGFAGNQPERLIISDIIQAIRRKRNLALSLAPTPLNLLIYVNSNPGWVLNLEDLRGTIHDYWELIGNASARVYDVFVLCRSDIWIDIRGNKARILKKN